MIENRMVRYKEKEGNLLLYAEWQQRQKQKFSLAKKEFETVSEYFLLEEDEEWLCLHCKKKATVVQLSFGGTLRLTCKECGHAEEGETSVCL